MKNKASIIFTLIGTLLLSGCENTPSRDQDRVIALDFVTLKSDGNVNVDKRAINVFYKANSDIPYYSFKDGSSFLDAFRKERVSKDAYVSYQVDGDKAILKNENNTTVTIDAKEQKITFSDFDAFNNYSSKYDGTLAVLPAYRTNFVSAEKMEYTKGKEYTIDLNSYDQINIVKANNELYIPFTTFNDLFVNVSALVNLIYSFNAVFFLPDGAKFYTDSPRGRVLTPVGEAYYRSKEESAKVEKDYAEYNYQNLCLNFDYLYGVKGLKGREYTSFDAYLEEDYKEDMLSGDVHEMDNNLAYALSYLEDFHTSYGSSSPLYDYTNVTIDSDQVDPMREEYDLREDWLDMMRKRPTFTKMGLSIDTRTRSAFIAFKTFDDIDPKLLARHDITVQEALGNSPALFALAYDQITSKYSNDIDYIIVDMATNNGGSSDALLFILSTLVGTTNIETQNPFTGAHNKTTYAADINRDGKYDENDKSFRELGKKVVFVNTLHAFSCGNALPVFAKYCYPNDVITMGETTGGGACVLRTAYAPVGTGYYLSGTVMLSKRDEDNNLISIEDGVEADIPLTAQETINKLLVLNALAKYLAPKE